MQLADQECSFIFSCVRTWSSGPRGMVPDLKSLESHVGMISRGPSQPVSLPSQPVSLPSPQLPGVVAAWASCRSLAVAWSQSRKELRCKWCFLWEAYMRFNLVVTYAQICLVTLYIDTGHLAISCCWLCEQQLVSDSRDSVWALVSHLHSLEPQPSKRLWTQANQNYCILCWQSQG